MQIPVVVGAARDENPFSYPYFIKPFFCFRIRILSSDRVRNSIHILSSDHGVVKTNGNKKVN